MAHSAEITDIEQFAESPQGLKDYWASELKAGNEAQQKWHKRQKFEKTGKKSGTPKNSFCGK